MVINDSQQSLSVILALIKTFYKKAQAVITSGKKGCIKLYFSMNYTKSS